MDRDLLFNVFASKKYGFMLGMWDAGYGGAFVAYGTVASSVLDLVAKLAHRWEEKEEHLLSGLISTQKR